MNEVNEVAPAAVSIEDVLKEIEEANAEENQIVKPVEVAKSVDQSAAQKRIDALRSNKYAQAAKKASTANNVDDFLDAVIEAEGAKKGIFGLEEGDYDAYSRL